MANFNAGGLGFTLSCPICGSSIQSTLAAAESGSTVTCPQGHRIDLVPDSSVSRARRDIDQSFKKLERSLKQLGRH